MVSIVLVWMTRSTAATVSASVRLLQLLACGTLSYQDTWPLGESCVCKDLQSRPSRIHLPVGKVTMHVVGVAQVYVRSFNN